MRNILLSLCFLCAAVTAKVPAGTNVFERDTISTTAGDVEITFIGHGTLMLEWDGKTIHVDPYGKIADYSNLPTADLILITHHHGDHMDPAAIEKISNDKTRIILTARCAETLHRGTVMNNGDVRDVLGLKIEAVPAYNIEHMTPAGKPYHPKGEGNGYILTVGKTRIYIAGDTENTPEMKSLRNIDVAFLPMNLPYTMTPEMVADAARAFKPRILYPYHYGETDPSLLLGLLKGVPGIDVRIRKMN
jgi:L-ascorbate metabolism protein UlaG (beta-lactamase superfamily)